MSGPKNSGTWLGTSTTALAGMSSARRCLKSPRSSYGVQPSYEKWSWMYSNSPQSNLLSLRLSIYNAM
jgi:hypothetical protein